MTEQVPRGNGAAPVPSGGASRPAEQNGAGARRRSPWPLAIVIGLILVAIVNVVFILIAVRGGEPVAPSYNSSER